MPIKSKLRLATIFNHCPMKDSYLPSLGNNFCLICRTIVDIAGTMKSSNLKK